MRHRSFRNPRYAPEWLERKLSPSTATTAPPADVASTDPTATVNTDLATTDPGAVAADSGDTSGAPTDTMTAYTDPGDVTDPPILVPPMPNGPAGPAVV